MKKEKKVELIKAAIPAVMILSGMWNAAAGVGNMPQPTSRDAEVYAKTQTQQEQPAETAFMQGEEDEGEAYLTRANGCKAECMASCEGQCEWECSSGCTGGCSNSCTGDCKGKCTGTCKGDCHIVCANTCNYNCKGDCTGANWE